MTWLWTLVLLIFVPGWWISGWAEVMRPRFEGADMPAWSPAGAQAGIVSDVHARFRPAVDLVVVHDQVHDAIEAAVEQMRAGMAAVLDTLSSELWVRPDGDSFVHCDKDEPGAFLLWEADPAGELAAITDAQLDDTREWDLRELRELLRASA